MENANKTSIELDGRMRRYDVIVGDGLIADCGKWIKSCDSPPPRKIVIVSNKRVFGFYGDECVSSLIRHGFETAVWFMDDGEEFKNFGSLNQLLLFLGSQRLTRADAVLALGGGVVGDLAGFAAAVYLRGIRYFQVPTTLLAMIDSSVGGKTGINFESGKNAIGAFHQPSGVLADIGTLKTLDKREVASGFYEAVKQGAVGGRELLDLTYSFLRTYPIDSSFEDVKQTTFSRDLARLVQSHVRFKLSIVENDENEDAERDDPRSRMILNFGHTVGHALEKVTGYAYFKHGEAVGCGILAAAKISNRLEFLDTNSLNLLNDVVASVGARPETSGIDISDLIKAIGFDKKAVGGSVRWVLLKAIGSPIIVRQKDIPQTIVRESLIGIF